MHTDSLVFKDYLRLKWTLGQSWHQIQNTAIWENIKFTTMLSNTEQAYLYRPTLLKTQILFPDLNSHRKSRNPVTVMRYQLTVKQTKLLLKQLQQTNADRSKRNKDKHSHVCRRGEKWRGKCEKKSHSDKACLSKYITNTGARPMTVSVLYENTEQIWHSRPHRHADKNMYFKTTKNYQTANK